jgi:alpha-tubulin suppressor-like RCC1 family protein
MLAGRVAGIGLCALLAACGKAEREQPSPTPPDEKSSAGEREPAEKSASPAAVEAEPAPATDEPGCPAGWGDCDGKEGNACETNLDSTPGHCGKCGVSCAEGERCAAGGCRGGVIEVSAGGSHSCSLGAGGEIRCWGLNGVGQLGDGTRQSHFKPVTIKGIPDAVQIGAGRYFTCVRRASGRVSCWGEAGQLGSKRGRNRHGHSLVQGLNDAVDLSAGAVHACAARRGGGVACWGSNGGGQLGDPALITVEKDGEGVETKRRKKKGSRTPVVVRGVSDAKAVACGNAHTCALRAGGTVVCWGLNRYGQLGDGTVVDRVTPVAVEGLKNVTGITGGEFHTCALTRAGEALCWGRNDAGQLGDGSRENRAAPTPIKMPGKVAGAEAEAAIPGVAAISAGERHTCLRVRSGRAYCWGDNEGGRLGDGTDEERITPVEVHGLPEVVAVSAGSMHTCAVAGEGAVFCWGVNDGQIGDGSDRDRPLPRAVAGFP